MFGPGFEPGIGVRENWEPGSWYFCDRIEKILIAANGDSNILPDLPSVLMLWSHDGQLGYERFAVFCWNFSKAADFIDNLEDDECAC